MPDLLAQTTVTANFKPGHSALGHRWELVDADGNAIGKTDREYGGGLVKRGLWRAVTATGMDSGNDIRAAVLDAGGDEVAHLFSRNDGEGRRVEVSRPDGTPLAVVHHTEDGFRYEADGRVVATLPIPAEPAGAWELLDGDGRRIGVVARVPAKREPGPSLLDYAMGWDDFTDNARDFQRTMHLGFAFSSTYSISLVETPGEPLRTLAVLTPVILGYAY